jgi:hypothetical protein
LPEKEQAAEKKWPYQFVDSKSELSGRQRDVVDLYAFDGDFDLADLKAFCRERKAKCPAEVFYLVVIFDKTSDAKFPNTPLRAEYGPYEDEKWKHIRAIYVFNKLNGFSELRYHPKNIWEHIPTREKV